MEERKRNKNTEYKNKYNGIAYDQLKVLSKKELDLPSRIQNQVTAGIAPSKQAYIIDAVLQKLAQDESK